MTRTARVNLTEKGSTTMGSLFNHSLHFSEPIYGRDPLSYHKMAENGGFEYYETRAHGCTKAGDIIQLDPDLQGDYPFALEHYHQVGLDCTDQVIWDLSAKVADDFPNHHLSVYLFTDEINAVRPDPARLAATKRYLDKNSFMRRCQGKAPIPKTVFGDTTQAAADYRHMTFPLYIKGAISSSGSSAYRCTNPQEVKQAIGLMHGQYQLQEDVGTASFLSVQYAITADGAVKHVMNTEQIMDGVEYIGTRYPTAFSPQQATQTIAQQAATDGLRGKVGFDVAASADGQYLVLECNPRWTGALYPMVIAERLGATQWSTVHLPVQADHLREIDLGKLAYNPGQGTGAVLVNWGGIRYHWLELLLIGSPDVQQTLHTQLAGVLR